MSAAEYCPHAARTKVRYRSPAKARKAKRLVNGGDSGVRVVRRPQITRIYYCPRCGGWHLTSQAPS